MKLSISTFAVIIFFTACNNTPKEPEATLIPSAPNKVDASWYRNFADSIFDYADINQRSTFKEIASKKITIKNTDIISLRMQYRVMSPDKFYSAVVYVDGNASHFWSNASFKPAIVTTNNEDNVTTAVTAAFNQMEKVSAEFVATNQANLSLNDEVIFTATLKGGKYLTAKTTMAQIENKTSTLSSLFSIFVNEVGKAIDDNYSAAVGSK